jgi:hypothetical protein
MSMRLRFTIVGIMMLAALVVVPTVQAADPQLDPACWTATECRQQLKGEVTFAEDADCGGGWGRCFPGVSTELGVNLIGPDGGTITEIADITQYVKIVYRYAVRFALSLAVIVIMIGGLMWLTSRGNAAQIKRAKSFVQNAFIGLLLAIGSYLLLQTINPDLIALRMPGVRMLRQIFVGSAMCSSLSPDVEVRSTGGAYPDPRRVPCGVEGQVSDSSSGKCIGDFCSGDEICAFVGVDKRKCAPGRIAGNVTGDGEAYLDGPLSFHVVCEDGKDHEIGSTSTDDIPGDNAFSFMVSGTTEAIIAKLNSVCGAALTGLEKSSDEIRGFYFSIEVNDEILNVGIDETYAAGSCGTPARIIVDEKDDPDSIDWTKSIASQLIDERSVLDAFHPRTPIAFSCPIALTKGNFPGR